MDEFWEFVEKFSPGMLSRQASDELHEFIDADKSGGIEVDEFLPLGRELRCLGWSVGAKSGGGDPPVLGITKKRGNHQQGMVELRCPFWLIWLKNRGRFLVYLVVQLTTHKGRLCV